MNLRTSWHHLPQHPRSNCQYLWMKIFRRGFAGRPLDEDAVAEHRAGPDEGDQLGCIDRPPAVLGGLDEFERHRQSRRT